MSHARVIGIERVFIAAAVPVQDACLLRSSLPMPGNWACVSLDDMRRAPGGCFMAGPSDAPSLFSDYQRLQLPPW